MKKILKEQTNKSVGHGKVESYVLKHVVSLILVDLPFQSILYHFTGKSW